MMVNIENTVRQAGALIKSDTHGDYYRHSITEFIEHLKVVKKSHEEGHSKEILDQFFTLYVFD